MATLDEQLLEVFRAKVAVIFVQTHESIYVAGVAALVASNGWALPDGKNIRLQPHVWDCVTGMTPMQAGVDEAGRPVVAPITSPVQTMLADPSKDALVALQKINDHKYGGVFVLHSMDRFLQLPPIAVHLLRAIEMYPKQGQSEMKRLVMPVPFGYQLPADLARQVTVIEHTLPQAEDLVRHITNRIPASVRSTSPQLHTEGGVQQLAEAGLGMTLTEFTVALGRVKASKGDFNAHAVSMHKREIVKKSGVLDFMESPVGMDDVGGLDDLKEWLAMRQCAFTQEARDYGLPAPKGLLLLGIPGCGKSLTAKVISKSWDMPLLRLDMGRIFAGLVGASEKNMAAAIQIAETVAPCILWVDEVEKNVSSTSGGGGDSGTSSRVFASLLTWLQEKTSKCFVVMTANSISALPPELLRKGRLDEIFFVDLPDAKARAEIFGIHLRSHKQDPSLFDLPRLAAITEEFSGAEIEQIVVAAMFCSFSQSRALADEDLVAETTRSAPLARSQAHKFKELREWADGNARLASTTAPEITAINTGYVN